MRTDQNGTARVWVRTTAVGQAEYLNICTFYCIRKDYAVGYRGIYWVEEKPQWMHIGGDTTMHGGNEFNHWMTSAAAYGIWYTAVEFLSKHPEQGKIAVNDMSLPFGGIFDTNKNWQTPHINHRKGKAVDVRGNKRSRAIPDSQQNEFLEICKMKGADEIKSMVEFRGKSNQHIHCRWP